LRTDLTSRNINIPSNDTAILSISITLIIPKTSPQHTRNPIFAAMPGRTRGPPAKQAQHDVAHQTSECSVENSNPGKWLDSLKAKALEDAKAIVTENSHAYTARQVFIHFNTY
jgi:hypothetical protein